MPPHIAAGKRRSKHRRWLKQDKAAVAAGKVHVQAVELVAQNDEAVMRGKHVIQLAVAPAPGLFVVINY